MSNKQTTKALLFSEDLLSENNYPQSRLSITLINNKGSFTNESTGEVKDYDKDKIKIISSKLQKRDGETTIKQKALVGKNGPYSIPDQNIINIEIDQLITILDNKDEILKTLRESLK